MDVFLRKQMQFNEEENIYDTSKTEYQNTSIVPESPVTTTNKFNTKLRKLYNSMTRTMQNSHSILYRNAPPVTETNNSPIKIIHNDLNKLESGLGSKLNENLSNEEQLNDNNQSRAQNEYVVLPGFNQSSEVLENGKLKIYEVCYLNLLK